MKRRIILLGPPGSGKGTIAARLQTQFGLHHVSSGHLLRQEVEKESGIGQKAKSFLDMGELVPDDVVLELMGPWLSAASLHEGVMFDGFPRNRSQAKALDVWLDQRGLPVEAVLFFDGNAELIVQRLTGRRSCPRCGRVYQSQTLPPRRPGTCDDCGAALVQREDDAESVVRKRYDIYLRETEPLANYYRDQQKLKVVDSGLPLDERLAATLSALN